MTEHPHSLDDETDPQPDRLQQRSNKFRQALEILNRGRDQMVETLADEVLRQGEALAEGGFMLHDFLETQGMRLHFLMILMSFLDQSAESLEDRQRDAELAREQQRQRQRENEREHERDRERNRESSLHDSERLQPEEPDSHRFLASLDLPEIGPLDQDLETPEPERRREMERERGVTDERLRLEEIDPRPPAGGSPDES